MLLAIDDLQWADAATLLTGTPARRRLNGLPIAIVGTCRPWPMPATLKRTIDEAKADGQAHISHVSLEDAK